MKAQRIGALIESAEDFAPLALHAARLGELRRIYELVAPKTLARASQVANYKLGVVIIHAANGAVAAKLRQITTRLRDEFLVRRCEVTEIRIKVQVLPLPPKGEQNHLRTMTPAAKAAMERFAAQLDASPLKQSLERLLARCPSERDHGAV